MNSLYRFVARVRAFGMASFAALTVLFTLSPAASAETLMMPNRDMLAGTSEVVWGITTLPNGSTYTVDFGDGVVTAPAAVVDRSYIALNHTYALAGTRTAKLTVTNGGTSESATVTLTVYNGATLSDFDRRNLNVNRAIQDGLRYLWTAQANRTTFDTNVETYWSWSSYSNPGTALAVLAFENHGYRLPNSNAVPTGIYPKYVVRRGFNYVLARLSSLTIGVTPAGNNPCISVPAPACDALYANTTFDPGYENGIALLPFAASGALNRTVTEVAAANVNGKTFREILQRMVNASIWGQIDSGTGRGGWYYTFNGFNSDGSTNGWELLALLDAEAAGATVPQWVNDEWKFALAAGLNNDGSYDYQADNNRAGNSAVNVAKAGVGVQGMFFAGRLSTDADLGLAKKYIGDRWNNTNPAGTFQSFACSNGTYNKGCAYGMFNVFKGFKLFGVQTLAGVGRAAGPGSIPSDDWYADYVDWLIANQTNPTSTTGGMWAGAGTANLWFSSQTANDPAEAALALLILAPTALVLPDEEKFSTVGLRHGSPLTTTPQTKTVTTPAGTHTVTATTEAGNGSPIPGVTVTFRVISGPNAGATGSGNTGANGQTTFTYTDNGGVGTDNIQAFVGTIASNVLVTNWVVDAVARCDADRDGDIDSADLSLISKARGKAALPDDPRDANGDRKITAADVKVCTVRCTRASCAIQ